MGYIHSKEEIQRALVEALQEEKEQGEEEFMEKLGAIGGIAINEAQKLLWLSSQKKP